MAKRPVSPLFDEKVRREITAMNEISQTLLTLLADGHFHSGTKLGGQIGRTRTAVWKAIQSLQSEGIDIYSIRGKGYRLAAPIELLDKESILSGLTGKARGYLQNMEVHFEVDSTNARLMEISKNHHATGYACLAERQQAGRGRRGRQWISPFGGNIYCSLLWRFPMGAAQLGGLSLAMAVAVIRALNDIGFEDADVKWPNDILVDGCKLAGILLELSGETAGPCSVVVGVGLNVRAAHQEMAAVDQPWTDLETHMNRVVARNKLAGILLGHLLSAASAYETSGLAPFLAEWQARDVYVGREVVLHQPQGQTHGVMRGVDENGALLLSNNGELQRFHSGEVSVRLSS